MQKTMNVIRNISADFALGKSLIAGKALLEVGAMLVANPSRQSASLARLILQVKPRYTMVKNPHLVNLFKLVQQANVLELPGDIVECGVWNGGSAALMAVSCQQDETWFERRSFWLFDSFEGLPRPGEEDGIWARDFYFEGMCKGNTEKVREIFGKLDVPMARVHIVPGWFDSTLGTAAIKHIALLHIDADWYDSVKVVLETLYDRVVPGGFVVLDDYGYWPGCSQAVTDYFDEHQIYDAVIQKVKNSGAYFQKPVRT
jgi:O-methyltransferase